jgi:hypothetical protein
MGGETPPLRRTMDDNRQLGDSSSRHQDPSQECIALLRAFVPCGASASLEIRTNFSLRRTFALAGAAPATRHHDVAAFAATALWALHPLHTATVTYVMQRSELLVSGCYLVTLSAFARLRLSHPLDDNNRVSAGVREDSCHLMDDNTDRSRGWLSLAAVAGLLGMPCKEVMVTAPLAVLLYDRTFITGSLVAALRLRPRFCACLAATWLLLAGLILGTDNRGASAGFAAGIAWGDYALTQLHAIALYLRLALWPSPLVFNYGRALTDLGRYPDALAQFEAAARLDPTDTSARTNAARLREFLENSPRPPASPPR